MKRLVLLVVAFVFALTMTAFAADKAAAPVAPADKAVVSDKAAPEADKKPAETKHVKKPAKKEKKEEKKAEQAAPAAPAAKKAHSGLWYPEKGWRIPSFFCACETLYSVMVYSGAFCYKFHHAKKSARQNNLLE